MPQISLNFDYSQLVETSEKVSWTVDGLLPEGVQLDFSKNFLPQQLSSTEKLTFLNSEDKRILNQISGNSYVNLFAFVEEYIIAMVCNHANAELFGNPDAMRALLRFADEELKHQQLFHRCMEMFEQGFNTPCKVLGEPAAVAAVVLSKSDLSVMLLTLQLEIMTQAHYVECVQDNHEIDELFKSVLHHHWVEESQHAKIDALELAKLSAIATDEMVNTAVDDYLEILDAFVELLKRQAEFDCESLLKAINNDLDEERRKAVVDNRFQSLKQTFLIYGMEHKLFEDIFIQFSPHGYQRVQEKIRQLK